MRGFVQQINLGHRSAASSQGLLALVLESFVFRVGDDHEHTSSDPSAASNDSCFKHAVEAFDAVKLTSVVGAVGFRIAFTKAVPVVLRRRSLAVISNYSKNEFEICW